jgi:hypothetical protein
MATRRAKAKGATRLTGAGAGRLILTQLCENAGTEACLVSGWPDGAMS